ncbi:hypothetical protein CIPAW_01G037500 [Carya illinoinensis]|uniref:Uncharacterized protein n=1 Tax=Carya illinoinensis TaxID=32201 RepID=A0A8T1RHP9_CARIL|nr:hypothetical protein CIPAW_01G037500 [Carya illinoinensis]
MHLQVLMAFESQQILRRSFVHDMQHLRCACMVGHNNYNKKLTIFGLRGRSHWSFPGVSPPLCSVVLSAFSGLVSISVREAPDFLLIR